MKNNDLKTTPPPKEVKNTGNVEGDMPDFLKTVEKSIDSMLRGVDRMLEILDRKKIK